MKKSETKQFKEKHKLALEYFDYVDANWQNWQPVCDNVARTKKEFAELKKINLKVVYKAVTEWSKDIVGELSNTNLKI